MLISQIINVVEPPQPSKRRKDMLYIGEEIVFELGQNDLESTKAKFITMR